MFLPVIVFPDLTLEDLIKLYNKDCNMPSGKFSVTLNTIQAI